MSLQICSIRVAAIILGQTRRMLAVSLVEVDDLVTTELGDSARPNIQTAINILFLLGTVRYDESADSLVYVPATERSSS